MMSDTHIVLAHGNGGRYMRELIDAVFACHLGNPYLDTRADAVSVPMPAKQIVITTDSFTVRPLEFPGGDIGSLAVHGTVNDLAVCGARPLYLTLNVLLEEGLELAQLDRIIASLGHAARQAGTAVVAGDTKVVPRGEGGGIYLGSTGVGIRPDDVRLGMRYIRPGDALLVSGPVGDHGVAVMLAREQFGLTGEVCSDSASVLPLTERLLNLPGLRFMRDPTRGGLATVAHESCQGARLALTLNQAAIPVRETVASVCEMLGYDPLYLACEGRVVAAVAADEASAALAAWRALPEGRQAAVIGEFVDGLPQVVLRTPLGGERLLEELEDDPLPRIC